MSERLSAAATNALSPQVVALVRFSARIAAGSETDLRAGCAEVLAAAVPVLWVEEAILQAYLFAGFPRALNATREWRRASGIAAPSPDAMPAPDVDGWRAAGEATCETVYGKFYEKLRHNIVALHPALDEWMIVEGYGKILSRPGLELHLRELCIVAACVASAQDRQLHAHLHGSLNAGASEGEVKATLECLADVVSADGLERGRLLLARVLGK